LTQRVEYYVNIVGFLVAPSVPKPAINVVRNSVLRSIWTLMNVNQMTPRKKQPPHNSNTKEATSLRREFQMSSFKILSSFIYL
jgi:hypothetical protein